MKLDTYHQHEALDRAHVVREIILITKNVK